MMDRVREAFSDMNLREEAKMTEEKTTPDLPRLCLIFLRDVIGFLPRETCGRLRLVSRRLDDELCSFPSSRLPRKMLKRLYFTLDVSSIDQKACNGVSISILRMQSLKDTKVCCGLAPRKGRDGSAGMHRRYVAAGRRWCCWLALIPHFRSSVANSSADASSPPDLNKPRWSQ